MEELKMGNWENVKLPADQNPLEKRCTCGNSMEYSIAQSCSDREMWTCDCGKAYDQDGIELEMRDKDE